MGNLSNLKCSILRDDLQHSMGRTRRAPWAKDSRPTYTACERIFFLGRETNATSQVRHVDHQGKGCPVHATNAFRYRPSIFSIKYSLLLRNTSMPSGFIRENSAKGAPPSSIIEVVEGTIINRDKKITMIKMRLDFIVLQPLFEDPKRNFFSTNVEPPL